MPLTIKSGVQKYKNPDGSYTNVDGLMSETSQEEIADIQSAGQAQVTVVQNAGAAQASALQTAGQTQITAIQNKGTEIINSLPSDYTEIEQDVSGLKSAVADLEEGSLSALGATAGQVPTADGDGSWEWDTPSGGVGDVQDVQVDGVSVVTGGVANVPIGANVKGVVTVSTNTAYGLQINSSTGFLKLAPASESDIKSASYASKPIGTTRQHESTFYGLAKAAGADMKDIASTTVGTYPEAQKSAIQTLLGISGIIAPVEDATASKPYAIGDAFLHGGALYKASAAIAAGDAIVPGTNCTQTTIIEMLKGA